MVIADVLMGFCYARNRPGQAGGGGGPGPRRPAERSPPLQPGIGYGADLRGAAGQGGCLAGFPFGAFVAGWPAGRAWDRRPLNPGASPLHSGRPG